ncbi:RNA 2',3'-cyclic phosphodiesterase [Alteribacillus bidgolensis]|uniref:RNA 2',3'-cyclic phosphodiesterase n=1 Tax=Alteribacillus bidgolensis TaxID=930129 RepID=A0A1G8EQE9_9BACI|nr:RNA 2',3'-cyclic phosphodiesterase [Alteribacillus bidgolensis]SDH72105.1 2'-5' RNA ligase [Alteribacillus bidgolensis]
MAPNPHYFIALPLPQEIKDHIDTWKKEVKHKLPFKKWVYPADYHITLFFLGGANNRQIQRVSENMEHLSLNYPSFSLDITNAGWFGKPAEPRIFLVGAEGPHALYHLQRDVSIDCDTIGFAAEKRTYKPHITVARKWNSKESFQHAVKRLSSIPAVSWTAKEFVIYRTHLDRLPKYERVETFTLRADK